MLSSQTQTQFSQKFLQQTIDGAIKDFHASHRVGDGYPPALACPIGKVTPHNISALENYCKSSKKCTFTKTEIDYQIMLTPGVPQNLYFDYPSSGVEAIGKMIPKLCNEDHSFCNCMIG